MASSGEAPVPGDQTKTATSILETATSTVQSFSPVKKIHQHLCAFHFYSYDLTRQIEAHHFCSHQNEEMRQCLIYDGPGNDARLIGIEYIVTEPIFATLPEGEQRLWHSHEYEVKSGVLYMPGVPGPIQRKDMEKLAKTYGKTFHFWQVDKGDPLPVGPPQLMMALTADGQLRDDLARDVEKKLGVSYAKERENRAYIEGPAHGIHPKANAGVIGKGIQLEVEVVPLPSATTRGFV